MITKNSERPTAPCQLACPAGIDVPSYVALIGQGRYREAVELIRQDNPFPWVCGLVCTHHCEQACVRGYQDKPISIMALKEFAASRVEAMVDETVYRQPDRLLEKVAIIGAGPSGLTVAYYLAHEGYRCTIFDSLSLFGGMLTVGIPAYRLPRNIVQAEFDALGLQECIILLRERPFRLGQNADQRAVAGEGGGPAMGIAPVSAAWHCFVTPRRLTIEFTDRFQQLELGPVNLCTDRNIQNHQRKSCTN